MVFFSPLFWLFVVVPLIEVALFAWVGGRIGILPTILIVVLTAAAGAALVKQQGLQVLRRAQDNMNRGVVPANELMDGVLILASGLLLLTPGFFTDAIGFSLLVPGVRAVVRHSLSKRFKGRVTSHFGGFGVDQRRGPRASEYEIIDESPSNERDANDR